MNTFQFVPGLSLRVVTREGEPWFVARDVCDVLGIRDTGQALDSVHPTDKAVQTMGLRGSAPWTVNESGLYSLILKSRKVEAKAVQRWVTGEVLGGSTDSERPGIPSGETTQ